MLADAHPVGARLPAKGFELQQLYRLINRFRGQARSYNSPRKTAHHQ